MTGSMLAAVRAAATSAGETENNHQQERSSSMSENRSAPGADQPGITQADLDKARTEAKAEGRSEGVSDVAKVLGAEGIAGNAARMSAAVEFLAEGMSAEKASAFATKHVTEATAEGSPKSDASLDRRQDKPDSLAAAGVGAAQPQRKRASLSAEDIYQSRRVN